MKRVLIAGGTGLIGQEITKLLLEKDYHVYILSRSERENSRGISYFKWDVEKQWIEDGALDVDHIVNLAGAGIADNRWTEERKILLINSRVNSNQTLEKAIGECADKGFRPKSFICASAIGYYGDSGDRIMEESDKPVDEGFLSKCTVLWEASALALKNQVDRLSIIRVGIVLAKEGGAFAKMLLPFKARMASYFSDGSMNYSWIHIRDIARIFVHAIESEEMNGTYNAVAPNVVTNKTLTRTIKEVKGGFYLMNSVPKAALRLAMGEMADVVLTSNNVSSEKIQETGFSYEFPKIKNAITDLLKD